MITRGWTKFPSFTSTALSSSSSSFSDRDCHSRGEAPQHLFLYEYVGNQTSLIKMKVQLHGYPPGYKFINNSTSNAAAHQVSTSDDRTDQSNGFGGFVQNLNSNQYQQLMSMFSTHLSSSAKVTDASPANCLAGICSSVSLSPLFSSNQFWIVDSGATRHICSQASVFVSLHPIPHTTVTLPNHSQILVHFAGDVKLHSDIVLKDVLFVPQFKFNLISVSALVIGTGLIVSFLPECFVIQDLSTKRMIGRGDRVQDLYVLDVHCLNSISTAFVNNLGLQMQSSQSKRRFKDIEKMVSLKGMVIRCISIIPEIREAIFRCLLCGYFSEAIGVDRGRISEPTTCLKQECLAKNSMTLVHNRCKYFKALLFVFATNHLNV
ncbi:hypothetical protein LWI29_032697 [Acer saccharum]|uniref:DNA helicase n=1 Tax=Acer saccharum TaxID=4024 RepID=A0AA39SMU2_ACESA|nr:hypothetical protein LWI29_032697 [Acer saccharum]